MAWIVMSGVEMATPNANRERCFELNAVGIATEAEAKVEADRRNAAEKAAGHDNVTWFPCPDMDEMMRQFRGR